MMDEHDGWGTDEKQSSLSDGTKNWSSETQVVNVRGSFPRNGKVRTLLIIKGNVKGLKVILM